MAARDQYETLDEIPDGIRGECLLQMPRELDDGWWVAYAHGHNIRISKTVADEIIARRAWFLG